MTAWSDLLVGAQLRNCVPFSYPQRQAILRVIGLVAVATRDGLRVAAATWVLFATIWTFIKVTDRPASAAHVFATYALFVEQAAQLYQVIAGNGGFVGCDGIVPVMAVAARRSIDPVCQVNQFVRYRDLDRLWLHIRFDKDQMAMVGLPQL